MGEIQNQPFQLSFNASLRVDFPRFPRHLRRRLDPGARTRRATRVRRIDRTTSDGLPRWEEYPVSLRRPAAAVRVHSLGGVRGPELCRAAEPRSGFSPDRLGEALGPWCDPDLLPWPVEAPSTANVTRTMVFGGGQVYFMALLRIEKGSPGLKPLSIPFAACSSRESCRAKQGLHLLQAAQ